MDKLQVQNLTLKAKLLNIKKVWQSPENSITVIKHFSDKYYYLNMVRHNISFNYALTEAEWKIWFENVRLKDKSEIKIARIDSKSTDITGNSYDFHTAVIFRHIADHLTARKVAHVLKNGKEVA